MSRIAPPRVHPLVVELLEELNLSDRDTVEIVIEPGVLAALHCRRDPVSGDVMLEPGSGHVWLESTSIAWTAGP